MAGRRRANAYTTEPRKNNNFDSCENRKCYPYILTYISNIPTISLHALPLLLQHVNCCIFSLITSSLTSHGDAGSWWWLQKCKRCDRLMQVKLHTYIYVYVSSSSSLYPLLSTLFCCHTCIHIHLYTLAPLVWSSHTHTHTHTHPSGLCVVDVGQVSSILWDTLSVWFSVPISTQR